MSLNSSVERMGKTVTQIIMFKDGSKKTYHNIDTSTIEDGTYTKFMAGDMMVLVNGANVNCIEVHKI